MAFDYQAALAIEFLGNTLQSYLVSLGMFLGSLVLLWIFKNIIIKYLEKLAEKTETDVDDAIIAAIKAFGIVPLSFLALQVATEFLALPEWFPEILDKATLVVAAFYGVKSGIILLDYLLKKYGEKRGDVDSSSLDVMRLLLKILFWSIAALFIISILGFNISALLTGLGIGGIAIAFALQNILSDIFASFSIYFDRPFQVGDFIVVGTDKGTVKKIGIKTTRVTTTEGDELVISNKELTSVRVRNYKKMAERRVSFDLGVSYQTPNEKMEKIPQIVKEVVEKAKETRFDRCYFTAFADSSLLFEIVYFISNSDIVLFRKVHQEISLGIKGAFEKEGIEIAYPTQTVFLKKD